MQQFIQPTVKPGTLIAFGLGYSAQALSQRLMQRDWQCIGTVRQAEKAERLMAAHPELTVFSGEENSALPEGAHWLISAPPGETGCPIFAKYSAQAKTAATITYLSTTGVYGDLEGGWAFEWSRLAPQSERAKRRVLAERQWQETGRPFRTVRLPGIYGPGRSLFDRLRAGTARRIVKPGQVFSRIHVDDIATGLEAMMVRPAGLGVFHLCDDLPAPPQDVAAYAAHLLDMPAPPEIDFDTADLSPMGRSFYAECKRVSNARAKSALGWFPVYKDYKTGLKDILETERRRRAATD